MSSLLKENRSFDEKIDQKLLIKIKQAEQNELRVNDSIDF